MHDGADGGFVGRYTFVLIRQKGWLLAMLRRALICSLLIVGLVFAADPLVGTWKLNVGKSTFSGPPPTGMTITYATDGDWVVAKSERVDEHGKPVSRSNKYKLDGKEYSFEGPYGKSMMTVKKTGERETTTTHKYAGGNTLTQKAVISADGKTRTVTSKGKNEKGQTVDARTVYERQ
jgi:hypothetical protein